MLTSLPPELLSIVVQDLVCEHLHEYFTAPNDAWPAISTLLSVSATLRGVTHSLLASGLSIPRLEDGRLSRDPLLAVRLARQHADKRFAEASLESAPEGTDPPPPKEEDRERVWWMDSPLLELYSVIRETRLKNDKITQEAHNLRRLADLPAKLVDPMQKVKDSKDTRLIWPALVEGAYLIACTTFVGQLSMSARFFHLVHVTLCEEPEWLSERFENIDMILRTTEVLEKRCLIYLHWVHHEHPAFVKAEHIYSSRIVPALRDFLATPLIDSEPMCAGWRSRVETLLNKWTPLENEHVLKDSLEREAPVWSSHVIVHEYPQDVTP